MPHRGHGGCGLAHGALPASVARTGTIQAPGMAGRDREVLEGLGRSAWALLLSPEQELDCLCKANVVSAGAWYC